MTSGWAPEGEAACCYAVEDDAEGLEEGGFFEGDVVWDSAGGMLDGLWRCERGRGVKRTCRATLLDGLCIAALSRGRGRRRRT